MCDIVDDFWNAMNTDELDSGRPSLPKLCVAPGVGDDTDKPKSRAKADKVAPQSFQMRATSIYSTDVDDKSFSDAGFIIGARIQCAKRKDRDDDIVQLYTIKKIDAKT